MKLVITQIHALLDKKEFNKFGDFIRSPFFNTEPRFIRLYELIKSEGVKLTRGVVAEEMFGKKSSSGDLRFRKLVSEFMRLFGRFLAETEFALDTLSQKFMVLEKFKKMNLRKEFLKQADETINYIEKNTVKDEIYYKNMAEVYAKKYSVEEVNFKDYNKDLSFVISNFIDKYFVAMKIFVFQKMTSLEYVFDVNLSEKKTYYDEILNYIEKNNEYLKVNDPEIYLRYLAIELDSRGFNENLYNEYIDILTGLPSEMKINDYAFYSTLLNLLSKFINKGGYSYNKNVVEVSKKMENRNLFRLKWIQYIDLKIIVESAISTGEYDWAIQFTINNKDHILHENKESVFKLMSGKLYFFKKDYLKARELLSGISVNDYIHYSEAKLIECRVEFELGNYNAVLDYASTVKKYLQSHKEIGNNFRKAYNLFANYIITLVKINESSILKKDISFDINKIEQEILTNQFSIYAQNWLIEKIKEIKKGRS